MTCPFCRGHGIVGGDITGRYAGPARWCSCPDALEREATDPQAVEKVNTAREKLIARFKPKSKPNQATDPEADGYHGEY